MTSRELRPGAAFSSPSRSSRPKEAPLYLFVALFELSCAIALLAMAPTSIPAALLALIFLATAILAVLMQARPSR